MNSSAPLFAAIGQSSLAGIDWLMIALYFGLLALVAWWVIKKGKDEAASAFSRRRLQRK